MNMKKCVAIMVALFIVAGCARTISDLILKIGDGTDNDVRAEAELGKGASNPYLNYNTTIDKWEFCNEGSACAEMGSGGGGGVPTMAKGSLFASSGTFNGEFTACADGESLEWDVAETTGFKCVTIDHTKLTTKGSLIIGNGTIEVQQAACANGQILEYNSGATNGVQCVVKPIASPFTSYTATYAVFTVPASVIHTNISGGPQMIQVEPTTVGSGDLYWQDAGGHRHYLMVDRVNTTAVSQHDTGANILPAAASLVGRHTSAGAYGVTLHIFDL